MMANQKSKSFSAQIQSLAETDKNFQQKLKDRLILESSKVENPLKFVAELFEEGVLSDGSSDLEGHFGFKEMIVQYAVTIACSKGPEATGGMVNALEDSGNLQMISALRTWAKENFGIQADGELSQPEGASAVEFPETKTLPTNVKITTESSSIGTKLIDKIMSRVEDNFMEQLEDHLVRQASEIVQPSEFFASLVSQNVMDNQLKIGQEVPEGQQIKRAIKTACSKKAVGSLVVALQSSKNERILEKTYEWLEASQVRKKNYPMSVKSIANQTRGPMATGIFVATSDGLCSVDLQTLKVTTLTSGYTLAVAVNHKLKKVYWYETSPNMSIMRSNFDGSFREIIFLTTDYYIDVLAIDKESGNVFFAHSKEIRVCNALGKNCAVVISNSSVVNRPFGIVVDSVNGVLYWFNEKNYSSPNSLIRANLDGSNATIISTGFTALDGITFAQPLKNMLYWTDLGQRSIGTIDVNTGNKRELVKLEGYQVPQGIQVDAQKIYFSCWAGKNIQSVDRDSGKELTTISKFTGNVYDLAVFSGPVKPT